MMIEPDMLTEVPEALKRLARLIARGFYSMEHAIIMDILVRNPCMKEDDMIELLQFDRKQLRALINTLKSDKFLKVRLRVETDEEGRSTRHNYYFINYQVFVNVVKYKLDHVRRKIETEERDNTSRASFKCPECLKTFTDLDTFELFDPMSQMYKCTFCQAEVEEDESAMPKKDARTLLAKFNEQIQPVYELLSDCENLKLAPELMEPEPTDIKHSKNRVYNPNKGQKDGDKMVWSGDATRGIDYGFTESTVTISMGDEAEKNKDANTVKERPVWMVESTIDGVPMETNDQLDKERAGPSQVEPTSRTNVNEIETLLFIHEKKGGPAAPTIPGAGSDDSSSDSEDDEASKKPSFATNAVEEMESDDDEEAVMVTIGHTKVLLHEVTDDMVAKMTPSEKADYIRLSQEMYQHMYE